MKTKYTPGPWTVAPSSNPKNGGLWRDIVTADASQERYKGLYVGEAMKHDAQLISAAPDMLEALENLRDNFDYPPAAYEMILAAIRKAKGES